MHELVHQWIHQLEHPSIYARTDALTNTSASTLANDSTNASIIITSKAKGVNAHTSSDTSVPYVECYNGTRRRYSGGISTAVFLVLRNHWL